MAEFASVNLDNVVVSLALLCLYTMAGPRVYLTSPSSFLIGQFHPGDGRKACSDWSAVNLGV